MDKIHTMISADSGSIHMTKGMLTMNLEQELLREHSKEQALKIASWVGGDARRLDQLMGLVFSGQPLIVQRAAWVVGIVGEAHAALFQPYIKKMTVKMKQPGVHAAVKRNFVRILQTIDIPRTMLGAVTNLCFDLLTSPKEPIAVKVFSMTVLARIAHQEPDLEQELRLVVEQQLPLSGAGFRSRAKRVLHMTAREA